MSNPFLLALKTNPDQFLAELETAELKALVEACVDRLAANAERGDGAAAPALQSLYRILANIEI